VYRDALRQQTTLELLKSVLEEVVNPTPTALERL
jgi:hypothetical protein